MSLASIVKAMAEQGCTAEQIAAAVLADEHAREARRAKLREGNAERQRRKREKDRHACHAVTERDPLSLKERSPTPPKENNPIPESPSLPARLPADFELSGEDQAFGAAEGLTEAEIGRALEDMRLWAAEAVGEKALRQDWHATARRFMRRDADAKRAGRLKGFEKGAKRIDFPPPRETPAKNATPLVHVKRDSPQGEAWAAWWRATKGIAPPMDKEGGWRFPAEWPPKVEKMALRRQNY